MDDDQRTGRSLPVIDLENDKASSSSHTAHYFDFTRTDDRGTNHIPELIDLTDGDNKHFNSNLPVIDLTEDNDQFLNRRLPVIDLAGDDDVTHQTQCFELTYKDVSNSSHTNQNFNLGGTDDQQINLDTKLINLTRDDIQDFNPNPPVIDLTLDNDKFLNYGKQDIDMTNDVQDIAKSFDMTDVKQQNTNDCLPAFDLTNDSYQNIDRITPLSGLTSDKDPNSDRRAETDLTRNDERVIVKPIHDVEMNDLSSHNKSNNPQKDLVENDLKIPITNLSHTVTEKEIEKLNETENMNVMHVGTSGGMPMLPRRKEILTNLLKNSFEDGKNNSTNKSPTKKFESRKETILKDPSVRNKSEDGIEAILMNHLPTNNSEGRKETISTSCASAINSEEKFFIPEKISENTLDFLKPAHHPIPLRHSLGRSTASTGQNIPIECTEGSEGHSRTLTVSSLIRRRKSKSMTDVSKHSPPALLKLPAPGENTFSSEAFIEFFPKLWVSLLLIFIGFFIGFIIAEF